MKLARKRLEVFGLHANVFEANAEELVSALPAGKTFDLVYSFGVLHHTPHPERAIAQIAQVLRPGGELRIMLYSLVSYKAFHFMHHEGPWDMRRMRATICNYAEAQTGCPYAFVYSAQDVRDLLEADFDVIDIRKDHIFTWDIPAYMEGRFEKAEEWQNVSDADLARLEAELGWHTLVIARRKGLTVQ